MCFVFLTGFDGSLKTNTFNCQQKHRRIYKQGPLLGTLQESYHLNIQSELIHPSYDLSTNKYA